MILKLNQTNPKYSASYLNKNENDPTTRLKRKPCSGYYFGIARTSK